MPGPGSPFTSETGRAAIKRNRGLKSWRTKVQRGIAPAVIANLALIKYHATALRRLHSALRALDGQCTTKRPCSCHYAALYGWNRQVIENELVRVKGELAADRRAHWLRWQAEQHARAVTAAAAKLDE